MAITACFTFLLGENSLSSSDDDDKEFRKKLFGWKNEVFTFVKGLAVRDNMSIEDLAELFKYCHFVQVISDPRFPTLEEKEKVLFVYSENNIQNLHNHMNNERFEEFR